MNRGLILVLIAIGLLIGLGSLYFLLTRPARAPAPVINAASVYNQALANVAPPKTPTVPKGAIVEYAQQRFFLHLPMGHLAGAPPPPVINQVPQLAGGTPAGNAAFQSQVQAEQAAYQASLQQEIDRLIAAQQAQQKIAAANSSTFVTSVLIPLIGAVAGFVTALAGLVAAFRRTGGSQPAT